MNNFLLKVFGAIDKLTDKIFRVKRCSCGHTSHCKKKCTECKCENCNCPIEENKFNKQIKKLKKRDPFIYK